MPRNRTNLTDEQIEAMFEEFGISLTVEDVVFTGDTIQEFIAGRENWAERGTLDQYPDDEYPSISIERGQPRKGMPRGQTIVIDLGDVRAVYSEHTTR